MKNNHNESAISLSITRQHREDENKVNKELELEPKQTEEGAFFVKMNLAGEITLVKRLHNYFQGKVGGYSTRSSFISYVFRLGLREALVKQKELDEFDKVINRTLNGGLNL
jgi:hypothetical protein